MPKANRYVLNQKALDGLLDIRDKYGHSMLAKAMRIDNSTLRRILRGKPFYISTGAGDCESALQERRRHPATLRFSRMEGGHAKLTPLKVAKYLFIGFCCGVWAIGIYTVLTGL